MKYRLYIDESGDHTYKNIVDPAKRYLCLLGVAIEAEHYEQHFYPGLESLKKAHFTYDLDDPPILHRSEVVNKRGAFWRLRDPENERRFNEDFLQFLVSSDFMLIAVVIDKYEHVTRYGDVADHPYHYCLALMLERYCGFLHYWNGRGDVLAEGRGGTEDQELRAAYRRLYEGGTYHHDAAFFENVLTSRDLKLAPKHTNSAGLQIADLLAHPCKQEILSENRRLPGVLATFGQQVCSTIQPKYNRRYEDDQVVGYGKLFVGRNEKARDDL